MPNPRIRKTIKWTGAALTVLLVTAWIGSGIRCMAWWNGASLLFAIDQGQAYVRYEPHENEFGSEWHNARHDFRMEYRPTLPQRITDEYGVSWHASCPLWLLAALTLAITARAWRLDTLAHRRARIGLCPSCNYNRTGLAPTALCPECGTPPAATRPTKTAIATHSPDAPR